MKKFFISVLAILAVLGVWACDEDTIGQEMPEGNEVGSYLLRQSDGFQQLLTLTTGGTVFSQNSDQRTLPNPFGNQQGAWERTGERKIIIKTLDFIYDFDTGTFTGYGRSTFTGSFDNQFNELTGNVLVEIFGLEQDPLDPDEEPTNMFGPITFEGTRITVD